MKITIREIAKLAGVSQSTVSKIINNYDDVSEKTKKKVLKIMNEKGYRPSYSAKSLASQVTHLIGVIFAGKVNADFNHPFFVEVINAFKKEIGANGYDLLFFSNERFNPDDEDYLARCLHYNVDGCIIAGGREVEPSVYELDRSNIPCIGVDIELTGHKSAYLMTDNRQALMEVVEHLYVLGHRDIAFIGGNKDSVISVLRLKAFKKAMDEYDLPIMNNWMEEGDFFEESGYQAMGRLLEGSTIPSAVVCTSDLMAFGAITAIQEKGLDPSDFAIVGYDDIDASRYVSPALTTIRQNKEKIGTLAARMMTDLIDGRIHCTSVLVDPELIIRESSNPFRPND